MSWEGKPSRQVLLAVLRWNSTPHLSLIAISSVIWLALVFPIGVSAHTYLLRTDPANGTILHTTPPQVRLWFSTMVSPEFSTAVVENAAHEYVNTNDAYLSPHDAREMDVPLPAHLPPGAYTVVWRADSDSDGLVLSGAYSFTIAQAGKTVPGQGQSMPLALPFSSQFNSLIQAVPLLLMLIAVCFQLLDLLSGTFAANTGQGLYKQNMPGARFKRREAIINIVGLVFLILGLSQNAPGIFSSAQTSPLSRPFLQQNTMSALTTFHAEVKTTDKQFSIELDINSNRCCGSLFAMHVRDAISGRPMVNASIALFATMLDMHMGTDTVKVRSDGNGGFKAQSDLSMEGLWQICMRISAIDHTSHTACVKVLIAY